MIKLNVSDLEGFQLALVNEAGEVLPIAVLGDEIPTDIVNKKTGKKTDYKKVNMHLHLTAGSTWNGEQVAEMPDGQGLYLKGTIYSRTTALESIRKKVGVIG